MDNLQSTSLVEKRICIYAKDIQVLTGKSERYARKVVAQVRQHYSKSKDQLLTIKEFCEYMHLDEQDVKKALVN
jgi:hypothetical protein